MTIPAVAWHNPFVGLRPFENRDSLYYFGRREQSHALLQQLYANRFVAVIGSSGCGKSSLVRAGLLPDLEAGFLAQDRDLWKIATLKPGDAPLYNLAAALATATATAGDDTVAAEWADTLQRRGARGLVDRLSTRLDADDSNLLVVADQFEELFRFQQVRKTPGREEAADFVAALLHLAEQTKVPVYIVLTMRSDFLGDCDAFQGLPEAMNRSQYLVPRLTRQQRREAIIGPIRLAGGDITPRLMDRLLNDSLEAKDSLPVMQHALMRTWRVWALDDTAEAIDLVHYEQAGTLQHALRRHADEALEDLDAERLRIARRMFQALTETDAANRGIRRPAHLQRIAAICGESVSPENVRALIERFNEDNRNFLVLSEERTTGDPLVDISHESLIRQWPTLADWTDAEAQSIRIYKRLAESAELQAAGRAGFYKETDLMVALDWQRENQPNAAWAARIQADYSRSMDFLSRSVRRQKTNRQFMIALIAGLYACVCAWTVIAAADDVALATNRLSLPGIGTQSSARIIFTAAPLALIGLHLWLLFHLQRLVQILSLQPQRVSTHGPRSLRLDIRGFQALAWLTVPAVLAGFWLRYLVRRDGAITGVHVGLLVLSVFLTLAFTQTSGAAKSRPASGWAAGNRTALVVTLLVALVLSALSVGVFKGTPERHLTRHRDFRALVPWIFHQFGYNVFFDLREQNISRLPPDFWNLPATTDIRGAIRGAFLKKADLRHADMYQAFVAKANLRNARLHGARLREADFRGADLRGARIETGDLRQVDFQNADLREARLMEVNMGDADLRGAQLGLADLRGADLAAVQLGGADLRCTDLRGVRNLPIEELQKVKTLYRARMDMVQQARLEALRADLFTAPTDIWHDMTTPDNEDTKDICR